MRRETDWTTVAEAETVLIRNAEPPDFAAIRRLLRNNGMLSPDRDDPDTMHRECRLRPDSRLVAELNGKIVDSACVDPDALIKLSGVVVHGSYRGRGVGKAVVRAAEATLRNHDCTISEIQIDKGNEAARSFWAKLGYISFYDEVIGMVKNLSVLTGDKEQLAPAVDMSRLFSVERAFAAARSLLQPPQYHRASDYTVSLIDARAMASRAGVLMNVSLLPDRQLPHELRPHTTPWIRHGLDNDIPGGSEEITRWIGLPLSLAPDMLWVHSYSLPEDARRIIGLDEPLPLTELWSISRHGDTFRAHPPHEQEAAISVDQQPILALLPETIAGLTAAWQPVTPFSDRLVRSLY